MVGWQGRVSTGGMIPRSTALSEDDHGPWTTPVYESSDCGPRLLRKSADCGPRLLRTSTDRRPRPLRSQTAVDRSILAEYRPKPNHLDLIHAQNHVFLGPSHFYISSKRPITAVLSPQWRSFWTLRTHSMGCACKFKSEWWT